MTREWIDYYNCVILHSALDYIAPLDQLEGRAEAIHSARDAKLEAARERRRVNRLRSDKQLDKEKIPPSEIFAEKGESAYTNIISSEDRATLGSNSSSDERLESVTDIGLKLCVVA
jgi:hypothetical protein